MEGLPETRRQTGVSKQCLCEKPPHRNIPQPAVQAPEGPFLQESDVRATLKKRQKATDTTADVQKTK